MLLKQNSMKLSIFKTLLQQGAKLNFELPNGSFIPTHYHITEIGQVNKTYIDCGGTLREEIKISFQLWFDNDTEHRLYSERLLNIIKIGEEKINLPDAEIEVEYQGDTIGKYGLGLKNDYFILTPTQTACLALDACGIPTQKENIQLKSLSSEGEQCKPGEGCC
jgi:hypothetical protein